MVGPLTGIRIVELAGLGPAPFAGMMLADHGAEVIRIERPGGSRAGQRADPAKDILSRSRKSIIVDLKRPAGVQVVRDLCQSADGLIEGFRPGVMERLGLGPEVLLASNPRLVFGRMTGWGQNGPYAQMAGHDINYIALSGVLDCLGRAGEKPTPPINLIGDFGGGGMMLAFGMLAALLHAQRTGVGQVVDCAMTEGAALLSAMIWTFIAQGRWPGQRGTNMLDTGSHYYDTYICADGLHIAVGAIEPDFYAELRRLIGLSDDSDFDRQNDRSAWPLLKAKIAAVFAGKTRAEWCAVLEGSNACFAPVLSTEEAPLHPHNIARDTFVKIDDVMQPRPAPRYSVSLTSDPVMPRISSTDTVDLLRSIGYDENLLSSLLAANEIA